MSIHHTTIKNNICYDNIIVPFPNELDDTTNDRCLAIFFSAKNSKEEILYNVKHYFTFEEIKILSSEIKEVLKGY